METEKLLINKKDFDIDNSCIICFENFLIKDVAILNCGHYYHLHCINTWLKTEPLCPICRRKAKIIEIIEHDSKKKDGGKCIEKCISTCIIL